MNRSKIIYSINIEDVQTVTTEEIGRELTDDELKFVEDKIGDYIDWFDTINSVIDELNIEKVSSETKCNMPKLDLKKQLSHLYNPSKKEVTVVDVPAMSFLMIDGKGDPNTSEAYQQAIEALYSVSYTLKFMIKKSEIGIDYAVMPLEGLWWAEDMSQFSTERKDDWLWTSMIMQPEYVTKELFEEAKVQAAKKKDLRALPLVRFEAFHEGKAAQILHIGPFAEEGPTVDKIHSFIHEHGHKLRDKHHEIYLSDFRRTAPEKLKTVIRQPFS